VNEDGKTLIKLLFPETDAKIRRVILFSNTFAHSTVVFKKSAWESTGGYDESFSFSEDWDLFFKFGSMGKFYNFQEYFACYLQGGQNISNLNTRKQLKFDIDLRKKYRRQYPNFRKAFFVSWFHYVFSFLLSSKQVIYISSKLKKTIIGY
jgi:hypothetical protein